MPIVYLALAVVAVMIMAAIIEFLANYGLMILSVVAGAAFLVWIYHARKEVRLADEIKYGNPDALKEPLSLNELIKYVKQQNLSSYDKLLLANDLYFNEDVEFFKYLIPESSYTSGENRKYSDNYYSILKRAIRTDRHEHTKYLLSKLRKDELNSHPDVLNQAIRSGNT